MRRSPLFLLLAVLLLTPLLSLSMTPEAKRSFLAFRQKAEDGDPEAMYRLSALLETGFDSIPADTLLSISFLRRSAEAGFPPAQNYLGYLYQTGVVLPANPDSAQYWIQRAADLGDPKAASNLAFLFLSKSPSESDSVAVEYLRKASGAGLPQAETMLADILAEGRIVPRDSAYAVALYEKAVAQGFADAQLKLLNLVGPSFRFLGSGASLSEALRYWNLGSPLIAVELLQNIGPAEPETPRAYALLGHAYSRGLGLPYDHAKANEYFARAALLGDPAAAFIVAETLEIFPDALSDILTPDITPQQLRQVAEAAGIDSAAKAVKAITSPLLK